MPEPNACAATAPCQDCGQRAHLLRLSPRGLSLYRRIVPRACALQAELAGALDPAELAALDAILTKLHRQAAQLPR